MLLGEEEEDGGLEAREVAASVGVDSRGRGGFVSSAAARAVLVREGERFASDSSVLEADGGDGAPFVRVAGLVVEGKGSKGPV